MKATLEFNLPEEADDHLMAVRAHCFVSVIFDLDNHIRNWLKHGHKFDSADDALEKVRDLLWESLREEDLVGIVQRG